MAWYVYHADHKDFAKLARLFTPGGTFTVYDSTGGILMEMRGHQEIEESITRGVGTAQAIHHLFSFTTEVHSPTSASSVINMEDLIIFPDAASNAAEDRPPFRAMHGYGHYRGEFEKIDGAWKITRLVQTRLRIDIDN
jgi:hypothetical protein